MCYIASLAKMKVLIQKQHKLCGCIAIAIRECNLWEVGHSRCKIKSLQLGCMAKYSPPPPPPPPPPPHPHWFLGQNLCNSGENLTQNCNGILLIGGGGRGGGAVLPLSRHHCLYILKCIKVLFGRTPELVDVREISTMLETIF